MATLSSPACMNRVVILVAGTSRGDGHQGAARNVRVERRSFLFQRIDMKLIFFLRYKLRLAPCFSARACVN
jgi:RNA-splicing ligase RtcB